MSNETERAALVDRLRESRSRVGDMCAERRSPRMSIPARPDDDDIFICAAVDAAIAALTEAEGERNRVVLKAVLR